MSEIAQDTAPRTFICTGVNWTAEYILDDWNIELPIKQQMYEVGARVLATLRKTGDYGIIIKMNPDSKGERPEIGTVLNIYVKGTDIMESIESHLCLADNGDYEIARNLRALHEKQLAEIEEKRKQRAIQHEKELKNFDALKEEILAKNDALKEKSSTPKKPRKKKNP